jgi:hypothetical protein
MWDNELYLSPNFTKDDYINLGMSISSADAKWDKAIEIFEDRIKGRFLNVVRDLLEIENTNRNRFFGYSFSVMAINCLLIETLQQFYYGLNTTPKPNANAFIIFLTKSRHFNSDFNSNLARIFYEDIRCGILHQAQTKRNSQLTYHNNSMVEPIHKGIRIDVKLFSIALLNEFEDYVKLIKLGEREKRVNFLKKMEYIVTV